MPAVCRPAFWSGFMTEGRQRKPGGVWRPRLVIFAKAPEMGRVKTRLARDIGTLAATLWYRQTSRRVIVRLAADPRWMTYLAVSPDRAAASAAWAAVWPPAVPRIPQGTGDLGARMGRVFRWFPPGPVVLIGSDVPGVTQDHIARAFRLLGDSEAVFGPAADGGYWLVGFKRRAPVTDVFQHVRWSSPQALDDTLAGLGARSVRFLPVLGDVDVAADL